MNVVIFSLNESHTGKPVGKVNAVAGRWLLWVDGVGGFLLLPGDDWTIGGPSGSDDAEICIQGDLSRREACIRRQAEDYVLQPLGTVLLSGRRMQRPTLLRDGDIATLGPRATEIIPGSIAAGTASQSRPQSRGVRLEFTKPHPLSASARLRVDSRHKTRPRSDAIILLADTCIIGPTRACHIMAPSAEQEIVLLHQSDTWFCRGGQETRLDGQPHEGRVTLEPGVRVETAGLTFSLEFIPS